ncbi:hypothetical protein PPMP20_29950 [Paraburkholderia phymatum]|nr:hypothetical protein [Paraburkholderia phymatum]
MNVFKLRQGEQDSRALSIVGFHLATSKKYPWYQTRNGKTLHYAVCPECDNPIHIVNLDVDSKVDTDGRSLPLYAKHAAVDIAGIGTFDRDAYEDCSLANPASLNGGNKTRRPGTVTAEICEMLMDHADAIQYMIERFLGASVSDQLFASILEKFHRQEGYLYREVSTSNLPYALLYMAGNQLATGCSPKAGSPFARALTASTHFELTAKGWIKRKAGSNAQLRFFVTDHVVRKSASTNEQTMMLVVDEEVSGQSHRLLREGVKLEIDFFRNLLGKRMRLREMAHKEFAGISHSVD